MKNYKKLTILYETMDEHTKQTLKQYTKYYLDLIHHTSLKIKDGDCYN